MTSKTSVDQMDLILLDALQDELPLVHNPWEIIGEEIGISAEEVLTRLTRMEKTGILRGIAPTLESRNRGATVSTLVALKVPEEKISSIAAIITGYQEVSHNFRRDHEYNLWFTLTAVSQYRIDNIIQEILARGGIREEAMLNLITERRYKIDVTFPLLEKTDRGP